MTPQPPKTSQGRREPLTAKEFPPTGQGVEWRHRHDGEWCDVCVAEGEHRAAASHPAPEGLSAREAALQRLVVRAHRHLVMRGSPVQGEATYLSLMDDLLAAVESAATLPKSTPDPELTRLYADIEGMTDE